MSTNEYAISLKTNRLISKSTSNYRRLKKLGLTKEIDEMDDTPTPTPTPEPTPTPTPEPVLAVSTAKQSTPTPEFDERDLQVKMAELTTDMVADNMKKIVRSQKLSDVEYDTLLKKMLYQKLCVDKPSKTKPKKPKKVKKKFKIVEPSESESSSESD